MEFRDGILYIGERSVVELLDEFGSPLYVYDEACLKAQFERVQQAISYQPFQLRFACKANGNLAILQLLRQWGVHLDVVSQGEIVLAERAGYTTDELLYTGNSVTNDELQFVHDRGIVINMDSLSQLTRYGEMFPGGEIGLRLNLDIGAGHHEHVITGGPDSKFGISSFNLAEAKEIVKRYNLRVTGLHQHIGSGILAVEIFAIALHPLLDVARQFEHLRSINIGGGLGIPYAPEDEALDVELLGGMVSEYFESFCQSYGRRLTLELEPGRYLVGPCGTLLTRVNTIKRTERHMFAGTDSGFNHLIRHPLYRSYHRIVNASRTKGPITETAVCGNLCESGDLFTHGREMVEPREGDIIAVCDAGAYGYSMSFTYNMRPRPPEVMISHGETRIIRRRETVEDLLGLFLG